MNPRYSRYYTYIRPVLRNPKIQTYSGFVFSIVTITIFTIFAIRPTLRTIVGLQKSINEQKTVLENLKVKAQNISQGKTNYDNLPSSVKLKLDSLIPQKLELSNLTNNLSDIASLKQASISSMQFQAISVKPSPGGPIKKPTLRELGFSFILQGRYPDLIEVLNNLLNSDRLLTLDSVNIAKLETGGVSMNVTAKTYIMEGAGKEEKKP